MIYALYTEDGRLLGVTNEEVIPLPGISYKELETAPDLNKEKWDAENLCFVRNNTLFTKLEFKNLFTPEERIVTRDSPDPLVQDILDMFNIAEYIDTSDPRTIQGLQYLVYKGLLTAERAQEILNARNS